MKSQTFTFRIKHFLSASILSMALIAMGILLKSEKPIDIEIAQGEINSNPLETVFDKPVAIVKGEGKLKKDYIGKHLNAAKLLGVGSLKDTSTIRGFVEKNRLIPVIPDKGYVLGDMTHSYPYLTEDAILVLRKIGVSFYQATKDHSSFTVSSLTRTEQTQKKLRRRNSNAAKDESSHCYGVSFDISYIRYNGVREWNYERTKTLEGILAAMQKNGEIYVLKERNQSCFHITVRTDK